MVVRLGCYHGKQFKGFRGVIQGESMYPTILNVVVDAMVQNWIEDIVESVGGRG